MKKKVKKIFLQKKKRSLKKIVGTSERPRLAVYRSHKHIYAQLIDDTAGHTLAFSSTIDKEIAKTLESSSTEAASFTVGQILAKRSVVKRLLRVVFDRGNRPYHGRIQKVAEGAREQGLIF
jgi:large subunit ribosomal protein L18